MKNTKGLKSGDKVIEPGGHIGTIYHVYDKTHVSLCIRGYETPPDMAERDCQTHVGELLPYSPPVVYFKCSNCGKKYKYIMGKNCPHCGKDAV